MNCLYPPSEILDFFFFCMYVTSSKKKFILIKMIILSVFESFAKISNVFSEKHIGIKILFLTI